MRTIYFTGIKKYQVSVIKGLEKSDLVEGIDYNHGVNDTEYGLIWIDEKLKLKVLKKAIGTKYIWKHRLRFFETYDEMKPKESTELTKEEKEFIERMRKEMSQIN